MNATGCNGRVGKFDILHAEYVFVVLSLVVGIYMVFVTGPFQAPDEPAHFFRAYQVSEGQLFGMRLGDRAGGWLPREVEEATLTVGDVPFNPEKRINTEVLREMLKRPFQGVERVFADFPNSVTTPPISYLPQALGIAAGRVAGLSALGMMYAGRLANLLFWVGSVFIAIRLAPSFKWVIVLIAVMPMTLFLASSLSADTMINSCSLLLGALVIRTMTEKERLSSGALVAMAILCVVISMMKLVYLPLVSLVLVIPTGQFGTAKAKAIFCTAFMAFGFAAAALWWLEIRRVYVPLNGANMDVQLSFVLSDPGGYAAVLYETVRAQALFYVAAFTGVLGWLDTRLPSWIYGTYCFVLIGTALIDGGETGILRCRGRVLSAGICCASFLLVAASMYLTWSKPGGGIIEGIQGRYLIPLAVTALLVFCGRRPARLNSRFPGIAVTAYLAVVLACTCLSIYRRYYG